MTSVMLKFYFRAASSQSASFLWINGKSLHLAPGGWNPIFLTLVRAPGFTDGGLDQEKVTSGKMPLHQPLSLLLPALTHPYQASEQVHLLPSDSWETQLVPLSPCYLSPFIPHCKLPAFCLCAEGEEVPAVPARCSSLTQRKSKCLSGSLVCISLLCLQLSREVLLQPELMPWNGGSN